MSDKPVISIQGVGKTYRIWESPFARLSAPLLEISAQLLPGQSDLRRRLAARAAANYRDFHALSDISFEVARGEAVGIIGRNGSGKSTLLQIIAGTLQATEGAVSVKGRVAALLELGSGFNPEFTGRENVFLTGAVMGLGKADIQSRFAEIEEFAEIGDFIEQPVKTYSSGMMVRLAFAVQTAVSPDILIVDEALSVGDFFFQQKCFRRIGELRKRGTTILFVSHDMGSVRDLCQRCLYLRKGRTEFWGNQDDAIRRYFAETSPRQAEGIPEPTQATDSSHEVSVGGEAIDAFLSSVSWQAGGRGKGDLSPLEIRAARFLDESDTPTSVFLMGSRASFEFLVTSHEASTAHFMLSILDHRSQTVTCIGTYTAGSRPVVLQRGESAVIAVRPQLNFEAGLYSLFLSAGPPGPLPNRGTGETLAKTPMLGPIEIKWDYDGKPAPFLGRFGPPNKVAINRIAAQP